MPFIRPDFSFFHLYFSMFLKRRRCGQFSADENGIETQSDFIPRGDLNTQMQFY